MTGVQLPPHETDQAGDKDPARLRHRVEVRVAEAGDFEKRRRDADGSASSPAEPNVSEFQFERPDWVLFRSVGTLSQKAGVPVGKLRRLAMKELTDNGLDCGGMVTVGALDAGGDGYFVQNDGPGLPGTPADIARLFSISRPLMSTKLWRLPSRGALGNGLRVVAGAVAASSGRLEIWTNNRHLILTPQDDGNTAVAAFDADFPVGTRVEITFGAALPRDRKTLLWAEDAIQMAAGGVSYAGKPSPWWYDGDHFFELLQAAGPRPVRDLIAHLDGCTGPKAGKIAASFKAKPCNGLSREQPSELLLAARAGARPVRAERLGAVGPLDSLPPVYVDECGMAALGSRAPKSRGSIPGRGLGLCGQVHRQHRRPSCARRSLADYGRGACGEEQERANPLGLWSVPGVQGAEGHVDLVVNITTPYCKLTTDGKEPDLRPFADAIEGTVKRAIQRASRALPKKPTEAATQKAMIWRTCRKALPRPAAMADTGTTNASLSMFSQARH